MSTKPWEKIRSKLHEKSDLIIGKSGISDKLVKEAKTLLKKKKVIKVKVLKNVAETKKEASHLIKQLSEKTGAKVGKIIGKTGIIYITDEENEEC